MNEYKIQCLECGNWFHSITFTHLKKCCDLNTKQYRKKYIGIVMGIFTDKHKENLSIAHVKSYENGRVGPMLGKKQSEESNKKRSETLKGRKFTDETIQKRSETLKGRKFSEDHCKNLSIAQKKLYENGYISPNKGRKHSDITKQKQRVSRIKEIEEKYGIAHPNFSLNGCKIFDYLNKEFNLKGVHALNGGEYHIKELGYFLDYYEPNLNLVIEFDEKHHKYLKKKDIQRQKQIEKYLNCMFIRINENDFENINEILEYVQDRFYEEVI